MTAQRNTTPTHLVTVREAEEDLVTGYHEYDYEVDHGPCGGSDESDCGVLNEYARAGFREAMVGDDSKVRLEIGKYSVRAWWEKHDTPFWGTDYTSGLEVEYLGPLL